MFRKRDKEKKEKKKVKRDDRPIVNNPPVNLFGDQTHSNPMSVFTPSNQPVVQTNEMAPQKEASPMFPNKPFEPVMPAMSDMPFPPNGLVPEFRHVEFNDVVKSQDFQRTLNSDKPTELTNNVAKFVYNYTDNASIISKREIEPIIFNNRKNITNVKHINNFTLDMNNVMAMNAKIGAANENFKQIPVNNNMTLNLTNDQRSLLENEMFSIGNIIREDDNVRMIKNTLLEVDNKIESASQFFESKLFQFMKGRASAILNTIKEKVGSMENDDQEEFVKWLGNAIAGTTKEDCGNKYNNILTLYNGIFNTQPKDEFIEQMACYTKLYFDALKSMNTREANIMRFDAFFNTLREVAKHTLVLDSSFKQLVDNVNIIGENMNRMNEVDKSYLDFFQIIIKGMNELTDASNVTAENVTVINDSLFNLHNDLTTELSKLKSVVENNLLNYNILNKEFNSLNGILRIAFNARDISQVEEAAKKFCDIVLNVQETGFPEPQKLILADLFRQMSDNFIEYINAVSNSDRETVMVLQNQMRCYVDSRFDALERMTEETASKLKSTVDQYLALEKQVNDVKNDFNKSKKTINDELKSLNEKYTAMDEKINNVAGGVTKVTNIVSEHTDKIAEMEKNLDSMEKKYEEALKKQSSRIDVNERDIKQLKKEIDELKGQLAKAQSGATSSNSPVVSNTPITEVKTGAPLVFQKDTKPATEVPKPRGRTLMYSYPNQHAYEAEALERIGGVGDFDTGECIAAFARMIKGIRATVISGEKNIYEYESKGSPTQNMIFLLQLIAEISKKFQRYTFQIQSNNRFAKALYGANKCIQGLQENDITFSAKATEHVQTFINYLEEIVQKGIDKTMTPPSLLRLSSTNATKNKTGNFMTFSDLKQNGTVPTYSNQGSKISIFGN